MAVCHPVESKFAGLNYWRFEFNGKSGSNGNLICFLRNSHITLVSNFHQNNEASNCISQNISP